MAYRSEIELALDEMISDETGMRFQGLAVIHAQQKWPQLVACERKKDGGLDAHADRASQPDGKGIGLACSIRASLKKLCDDAEQVKKHHPDVHLLIFSTAKKVGEYEKELWGKKILEQFGFQLVVVSREEFISWLRAPAQADICRELGIAPPMGQDLEPAFERAQKAAQEIAVDWDRAYRKPWRPVINLNAFKLDEQGGRNYFNRGTCKNDLYIRRDALEERLLGRLQSQLLQPEVIDYAVSEFGRQLRATVSGISDDMSGLKKRREELEREIKRFSDAIACGGPLESLVRQIAIREDELKAITNKLQSASPASIVDRIRELRRFVEDGILNLQSLLNRDPALAKAELGGHLSEIRMTPNRGSKEWHYVAEGSWNLLGSGPNAPVMELAHSDGCGGWI